MNETASEPLFRSYIHEGRSVSLNLFFTIPLLILYEIGIQLTDSNLRNAAEVIIKNPSIYMGSALVRWFHWFLIILAVTLFVRTFSKERPVFLYFLLMLLESLLLAFVLGPLLSLLVGSFMLDFPLTLGSGAGLSVRLLLSVGAGVYEELLFRFLILGGLFLISVRFFRAPRGFAAGLALVISSFLFAAYHHLGPQGQPVTPYIFFFRMSAGLILGGVFIARGLSVAVYLHVFYDIIRDIELVLDAGA